MYILNAQNLWRRSYFSILKCNSYVSHGGVDLKKKTINQAIAKCFNFFSSLTFNRLYNFSKPEKSHAYKNKEWDKSSVCLYLCPSIRRPLWTPWGWEQTAKAPTNPGNCPHAIQWRANWISATDDAYSPSLTLHYLIHSQAIDAELIVSLYHHYFYLTYLARGYGKKREERREGLREGERIFLPTCSLPKCPQESRSSTTEGRRQEFHLGPTWMVGTSSTASQTLTAGSSTRCGAASTGPGKLRHAMWVLQMAA